MGITDKLIKRLDNPKAFVFAEVDIFANEKAWISTGSPSLDYRLKTHGWPTGIIEVTGESQSGKTTLSLHAMKQNILQYKDRAITVILSSERRDNRELALMMGVPVEEIMIVNTSTVEAVFDEMARIVDATNKLFEDEGRTDKPRFLFVWDSLGQTPAKAEVSAMKTRKEARLKGDEDKNPQMAAAAKAIQLGLRSTAILSDENELTFFIINRSYDNMNSPGKTSYGGKAMKFWPKMRFDLVRTGDVKVGEDVVGQITEVRTVKTDFDRPKQRLPIEIGYGYGIVLGEEDIKFAIDQGILKKHGAYGAKFNDKLKWSSRRELYEHYENRNPMLKILIMKLTNKFHALVVEERESRLKK